MTTRRFAIGSGGAVALHALWILAFLAAAAWFLAPGAVKARDDRMVAFALHIVGGTVVLLTGPFQFVGAIRNRFPRYHRLAGYAFAGGSAAAILGFVLMQPVKLDTFFLSQATAILLWTLSLIAAVVAIRRRQVLAHQHNMARAFVLAAYFVIVRVVDRYLMWTLAPVSSVEAARLAHSDWLAWVVPLVAVEIWFGLKWSQALYARRPRASVDGAGPRR
jgi:uncharacterized membrane protein YozB (DUF420 family)